MSAPRRHIVALRERLGLADPAPVVTFKNGSVVRIERRVVVEGFLGAVTRFDPTLPNEVERAYEMAVGGAYHRIEQPKGDPADYGDEAPW